MTGFDVCVECGDLDETSVVLVSSRDAADYGSLIESSGASGFVPKAELSGEAIAVAARVRALRFGLAAS